MNTTMTAESAPEDPRRPTTRPTTSAELEIPRDPPTGRPKFLAQAESPRRRITATITRDFPPSSAPPIEVPPPSTHPRLDHHLAQFEKHASKPGLWNTLLRALAG